MQKKHNWNTNSLFLPAQKLLTTTMSRRATHMILDMMEVYLQHSHDKASEWFYRRRETLTVIYPVFVSPYMWAYSQWSDISFGKTKVGILFFRSKVGILFFRISQLWMDLSICDEHGDKTFLRTQKSIAVQRNKQTWVELPPWLEPLFSTVIK